MIINYKRVELENTKANRELLVRIQKGDKVAFYKLYNCYCRRLYAFIFRYLKHETDTEEIVQEVFIKIWESRDTINLELSFESFLFTIAYNKTISVLRKRVTDQKYINYLNSLQQTSSSNVIDEIYFNELNEKVDEIINKLTPQQKQIFVLSREKGLNHKEIAEQLNITVNTVKKHMTNALLIFKTELDYCK